MGDPGRLNAPYASIQDMAVEPLLAHGQRVNTDVCLGRLAGLRDDRALDQERVRKSARGIGSEQRNFGPPASCATFANLTLGGKVK